MIQVSPSYLVIGHQYLANSYVDLVPQTLNCDGMGC